MDWKKQEPHGLTRRAFTAAGAVAAITPARALAAAGAGGIWNFGQQSVAWQPFEIAQGDTCLVSAAVRGTPAAAILDSGSGATIVDRAFAARVGLGPGESRTLTGLSGRTGVTLVRDVEVKLGHDIRRLPFVVVGDLGTISRALGRPVDMLAGADMFAERCIALDFAARRFAIAASGSFAGGDGWRQLPLTRGEKQVLITSASVVGGPPVPLMVDLGSSAPLMLASSYLQERTLLTGRQTSSAALGGVEGVREVAMFTLDRIELAGLGVTGVPTLGMNTWQVASAVGNIGLPLLGQFEVVFDVTPGRLWLRPLPAGQRLSLLKDRSGLGLSHDGGRLTVMHVAPNSPAAQGGWKAGEAIVEVNGLPVGDDYARSDRWRWRYGPAGSSARFRMSDGQRRTLRLADYF